MLKLLLFGLLFFLLCLPVHSQAGGDRAELLATFDRNTGDVLNAVDNLVMQTRARIDETGGRLAIRVCSEEPMPTALSFAAGRPFFATQSMESYGGSKDMVLYLRSVTRCKPRSGDFATEYWFVPEGAEYPEFIEARLANHLVGIDLIRSGNVYDKHSATPLTPDSYLRVLERAILELKQNRTALIFVVVPSQKLPSNSPLMQRAQQAVSFLTSNGISEHRIMWRRTQFGDADPIFPHISLVKEQGG